MCKEEAKEGEEENPAKKLKLEMFKLDKETKGLVDLDTVIEVNLFICNTWVFPILISCFSCLKTF